MTDCPLLGREEGNGRRCGSAVQSEARAMTLPGTVGESEAVSTPFFKRGHVCTVNFQTVKSMSVI